ncbi:MAG: hypothetical protein R2731_05025 [Nocardioides sp.]
MPEASSRREAGAVRTRVGLAREPAVLVLVLALTAMVKRGYLLDELLVAGALMLVVADAGRWRAAVAVAEPGPVAHRIAPLAAAFPALAMAPLPRLSRGLDLACAVVGLVVLVAVWWPGPGPDRDGEPPAPPRWWLWPGVGVALCLVELSTLVHQPAPRVDSVDHPSLSTVIEPVLDLWPSRAAGLWLWLLAGWWLVRRVRAWAT